MKVMIRSVKMMIHFISLKFIYCRCLCNDGRTEMDHARPQRSSA